jgi:hypothetical protein
MSDATTDRVAPRFCNPDDPPERFPAYREDFEKGFDMIDTPEHVAYWPRLKEPLEACRRIILPEYQRIDDLAMGHQNWHRLLAFSAAFLGTAAVLLAIAQLAFEEVFEPLGAPELESFAILLALIAVGLMGMRFVGKSPWLLERHKAERLRLLKFRFLVDRGSWCGPEGYVERDGWLRDEMGQVLRTDYEGFKTWAEKLGEPLKPEDNHPCPIPAETLRQLVEYYRAKRVIYQRLYFDDRKTRHNWWSRGTGLIAPVLFFASVVFVLLHFLLDRFVHEPWAHDASRWLIFFAALLPTVSAGVRGFRAAHEFERNRVRYHAKEFVLDHKDADLRAEPGPDAAFRDMEFCERVLGLEHLEWARLMYDVEFIP